MGTATEASYEYHQLATGTSNDGPAGRNHIHQQSPVEVDEDTVIMWKHMAISECSATCGHGLRTLVPKCVDAEYPERPVLDEVCQKLEKPLPIVQPCFLHECQPL